MSPHAQVPGRGLQRILLLGGGHLNPQHMLLMYYAQCVLSVTSGVRIFQGRDLCLFLMHHALPLIHPRPAGKSGSLYEFQHRALSEGKFTIIGYFQDYSEWHFFFWPGKRNVSEALVWQI